MKKYTVSLALMALALLFVSVDVAAGTGLVAHLFSNPEGVLMAPIAAAALPEAISAELNKISDQIKAQAEEAQKEIKAHAKLSEETRANVDRLLTEQGAC